MMYHVIEKETVVACIKQACKENAGDESTQRILINTGANILNCSPDAFIEEMNDPTIDIILSD